MRTPFIALACLMGSIGIVSASELKIEGANISRDIPCHNQNVGIYGAENKIVLTGVCKNIDIHGSKHHVTFEKADEVEVSGSENVVIGGEVDELEVSVANNKVTATLVPDDDDAKVEVSGAEHTLDLTLKGKTKIEVSGAAHKIEWTLAKDSPEPFIEAAGISNTITKK